MFFKKIMVVLGILLANNLQADGHLPAESAMLKKAEAFIDANVGEEDDLLDEEAFCVGVGVVVVVVACVEEGDV